MLKIKIKLNPYEVFYTGDVDVYEKHNVISRNLASHSIINGVNVDLLSCSDAGKGCLINKVSSCDFKFYLTFEHDDFTLSEPPEEFEIKGPCSGFRFVIDESMPGVHLLRAAIILELLGLEQLAFDIKCEFYAFIVSDIFQDTLFEKNKSEIISSVQSEKARKPRNKHYSEVMEIIRLTWEKYPAASPTGMQEKLSVHYHGKVSRGALGSWVNGHEARPPKPEKYQRFDLVFPQ